MSGAAGAQRKLRIGMLGLYGMTMPRLHFTGFETGFGEIAPRLVEMGHEVVMYCRRGSFPAEMRVPEYKGVPLVTRVGLSDKDELDSTRERLIARP